MIVAVPNFGDIAANAHFGFEEGSFFHNPGDQTISPNATYQGDLGDGVTMPFSGGLLLSGEVYLFINGTGFQYAEVTLACAQPMPYSGTPTSPKTYVNGASATNSTPIFTVPVWAYITGVAAGKANEFFVNVTAGNGVPDVVYRTCTGHYRVFRE
jgi:hypothetical protein